MVIRRRFSTTLATALALVAFACTPAKAPGSNPEDMTPEEHQKAAEEEKAKAAEHEQEAESVGPSKPMTEESQKAQHENQAETHESYSEQHKKAGEAAAGAGGTGSKDNK
jgi:hypothetical protein